VVITGASAGIGEAAARQFAAEGALVVLAARGEQKLQSVVDSLPKAMGVPTDVGNGDACKALIGAAVAAHGRIDVLVNNAGLHHRGDFRENTADQLADMVRVNLWSPVLLSRLALESMPRGGSIVNVASLAGRVPLPGSAVYSSTKFGLRALSIALAQELVDDGIRVSVVSPGPVDTGFIMDSLETVSDLTLSQPMSTADEVAAAVLDCAADGRIERAMPPLSGVLTTLGYVSPSLRRWLKPVMERKGARARRTLLRNRS
jgi:hypothetical protein